MENEKYYTVKQFAELVGMTQQGIYRQFNNKLADYIETINNKKMIKADALKLYEIPLNDCLTNNLTTADKQLNNVIERLTMENKQLNNDLISTRASLQGKDELIQQLREQIHDIKQQIQKAEEDKEKLNGQLTVKDNQIQDLNNRLEQNQILLAMNMKQIESKNEDDLTEHKGFFKRLFGKKEK